MGSGNSSEIGGVRVFKVSPGSPAYEAGLEVFFDFIMEINGCKMDSSYQKAFTEKIQESENGTAKMKVYNLRAQCVREVAVSPKKWAGNGLLGATVRYDVADPAESSGIRVLEVFPNSPAAHAGLVPFQDYLLGTASSVFRDIDELAEVVTSSINQRMQVYVYNTDSETVREVILVPNNEWGGDGCIGCDIGTGLLHRLPAPRRLPGGAPSAAVAPPSAAFAAATYPSGAGPATAPLHPTSVAAPLASALIPVGAPVSPPQLPAGVTAPPLGAYAAPPPTVGVPAAPPAVASAQPPLAPATTTSEAMAQLQAQISQLGKASSVPPPAKQVVGGIKWPPAPGAAPPQYDEQSSEGSQQASPDCTTPGPCKAPPSTPMNLADPTTASPSVDLSAAMYPAAYTPSAAPPATNGTAGVHPPAAADAAGPPVL